MWNEADLARVKTWRDYSRGLGKKWRWPYREGSDTGASSACPRRLLPPLRRRWQTWHARQHPTSQCARRWTRGRTGSPRPVETRNRSRFQMLSRGHDYKRNDSFSQIDSFFVFWQKVSDSRDKCEITEIQPWACVSPNEPLNKEDFSWSMITLALHLQLKSERLFINNDNACIAFKIGMWQLLFESTYFVVTGVNRRMNFLAWDSWDPERFELLWAVIRGEPVQHLVLERLPNPALVFQRTV